MRYRCFTIAIIVLLISCFILYFIPGVRQGNSENRTMARFDMVFSAPETDSIVYHKTIAERFDAALSDQFPLRETISKGYLSLSNTFDDFVRTVAGTILHRKKQGDQLVLHQIGKYALIEDTGYITACPSSEPLDSNTLKRRADQIEYIHGKYPDLKIYVYYVSRAFDTPWFNDYLGTIAADHYREIEDIFPEYVKKRQLKYDNLDDYMVLNYKTDHHWNHEGAYRGYVDVYNLMDEDFEMGDIRKPIEKVDASDLYNFKYLGSYGTQLGELYKGYDKFLFYKFDTISRDVSVLDSNTLKEIKVEKIGLQDEYENGQINKDITTDHYVVMYGTAKDILGNEYLDGEFPFIIRNEQGNGCNLLITGDSYDRAMRDVLSTHFDTTVYFDYRLYQRIAIDYLVEKYDIDALLISANAFMWGSDKYLFTFAEEDN